MNCKHLILTHFSQKYNASVSKMEYIPIKIFRDENKNLEFFQKKTFLALDFFYVDFEFIDKVSEWNDLYTTYTYY